MQNPYSLWSFKNMNMVRRRNDLQDLRKMLELLERTISDPELKSFYDEVEQVEKKTGKRLVLALFYLMFPHRMMTQNR